MLAPKDEHSTAFAGLSDHDREKLFCVARRITRTREDAEDAVQDTLLRAFVRLGDFEGGSNFGTWLTRITINSSLMILRKKRTSLEIPRGSNNDFGGEDLCYEMPDLAPNPETCYAQTEERRILGTAIERLRPNLRVVVQIHLQGRSMRETAEALGISVSAAKARLFHAKKALRRSAIGKLAGRPRSAGKLRVLRLGILGRRTPNTVLPLGAVESEKKKETRMSSKSKEHQNADFRGIAAPQGEEVNLSPADSPRLEAIRIRAYEIYLERGGQPCHDLDDWLQAERELEPNVRAAHAGH